VLSPTRELASQILASFRTYGRHLRLGAAVVFGGVPTAKQVRALAAGVDVLVATPGRLLDLMGSGSVRLDEVEILVLDEADRMLDMGFIQPIKRIVGKLPRVRQSLCFSATMPPAIAELAGQFLRDPVRAAVTPVAATADRVEQRVVFVDKPAKRALLAEMLGGSDIGRALVFTRTKHGADQVVRHLERAGIPAGAIHGNKSQSQRERALAAFRSGRSRILVATDIAARGIDVEGVTHVINYEIPNVPETYVHRIGRTARAGAEGVAISFCDGEERAHLRGIEALIRQRIPAADHRGDAVPAEERRSAANPPGRAKANRKRRAKKAWSPVEGRRPPSGGRPEARSRAAGREADARPHSDVRQDTNGLENIRFLRSGRAEARGPARRTAPNAR
jgi:ATP-dependent RNA helicase RhlE